MDVLVGPTFTIDVSSPPYVPPQDNHAVACLFLKENGVGSGIGVSGPQKTQDLSDSSSSIGAPDDSEDDSKGGHDDGDEVQSKFNCGGLGSLDSLEDSLPIKRGLSNYFSGKSKSFASLSEVSCVSNVKEVEKRDNPFNKRRRVLIASKWSRKSSSFYNWPNPKSMPLLALNEEGDDEEEEEQEQDPSDQSSSDEKEQLQGRRTPKMLQRRLKSFKTRSCYCLSDLEEHKQQLG